MILPEIDSDRDSLRRGKPQPATMRPAADVSFNRGCVVVFTACLCLYTQLARAPARDCDDGRPRRGDVGSAVTLPAACRGAGVFSACESRWHQCSGTGTKPLLTLTTRVGC